VHFVSALENRIFFVYKWVVIGYIFTDYKIVIIIGYHFLYCIMFFFGLIKPYGF